ncbi:MAG TPA: thiol-disulfide isomerase, partial [Bryobacteraceae bacterium]|nr:thiol-disulfide isomerase [Bryobacteraceae bacterium]
MRAALIGPILACGISLLQAAAVSPAPTFSRDIAPILQRNCQACHRAGEAAPMPLTTYKEVRPYAAAIKEAVALRKMPPWFADPHYGRFSNERTLSQAEIDTLVAWAKRGAPEGDPKDLPPPPRFLDGWNIANPDLVLDMPSEFLVPATGTLEYQYFLIPLSFKKNTWVQMAEVRPGNRKVVHHVIAWVRPPGSKWMQGITPGKPFVPSDKEKESEKNDSSFLVGYAPGAPPTILPDGRAKLIKAGSDVIFEVHYTTNGTAATDRSKIGFTFAKTPVRERVVTIADLNSDFAIPPKNPDYRVDSEIEFAREVKVVGMFPHM